MKSIVLMYHGLYESESELTSKITDEDRPYAVSKDTFKWQMERVKERNNSNKSDQTILITFDDGHISNYTIALPLLSELELSAYFFVTTNFMKSRDHFCRPEHVKELHMNGMEIGSHGVSHRFLDKDLSTLELNEEFQKSKDDLEQVIGQSLSSISFPGGRYCKESLSLALEIGYQELFGSRYGINDGVRRNNPHPLMRVAIRSSTGHSEFNRIIEADTRLYHQAAIKQFLKSALRNTLGNKLYHGLYKSLAG